MTETLIYTARVSWQANLAQWWIEPFINGVIGAPVNLIEWAADLPDQSRVRLLLSSSNYSVHWADLPGVNKRHLARAIPFALEEALIGDLDDLLVVPTEKELGLIKAYVLSRQLVEQLIELCRSYHLVVTALIPETSLLKSNNEVLADGNDWLVRIAGHLEGRSSQATINALLDSVLSDYNGGELQIHSVSVDQGEMLKTNLEVGLPNAFNEIQVSSGLSLADLALDWPARPISLLAGIYEPRSSDSDKPRPWFTPLLALAASWLILVGIWLAIDNHQLSQRSDEIHQASVQLYKQLFPGERVGAMERSIRSKLSEGEGGAREGGFLGLVGLTASAYSDASISQLSINSIRFNERQQELLIEVSAANMADLQTFQKAIEEKGLGAEVASANNEKEGVKGRLKIKESV